jgi:ribosomal protein L24E
MLSMTSPKDGRTLRIFRCKCGKLTSAEKLPLKVDVDLRLGPGF